jgi:hypothetical protein
VRKEGQDFLSSWIMKNFLMLTFSLVSVAFLMPHRGIGQQKWQWSSAIKDGRYERNMTAFSDQKNRVFIASELSKKDKSFRIVELELQSMHERVTRDFNFPDIENQRPIFDEVLFFSGRILACATTYSKDEELVRTWAFWCSTDSGITSGPILLGEHPSGRRTDEKMFGYVLNTDSTALLVYPRENFAIKNSRKPSYRLVDQNLETIWEKNLDFPAPVDLLVNKEYRVDKNGQLYMLSGVAKQVKARKETQALRSEGFSVAIYNPEENKIKEFEVDLEEKWVHSADYAISRDGDLIIAGFFSNDRYFSISGTYFFKIDGTTKQITAKSLNPFSEDFLKQFSKNRNEKFETELEDIYFDNLFLTQDGGVLLTGESYNYTLQYRTDITTGRQQVMYYYYFNDIVSVRLDKEGKESWSARTPKFQETVNDEGSRSSYAATLSNDVLYLVFNDDPVNAERWTSDSAASLKVFNGNRRDVVAAAAILDNGKQSRNNPQGTNMGMSLLNPRFNLRVGNSLIVMARTRKEMRFARIQF